MLHPHFRAQRRTTNRPRSPRFRRPRTHLLSVTVDTLPSTDPLICVEIRPGHWLVIARDGAEYDEVAFAYVYGERCPPWVTDRMYSIYGIPRPDHDLRGYFRMRWWPDSHTVTPASVGVLETIGGDRVTRWPHAWLL